MSWDAESNSVEFPPLPTFDPAPDVQVFELEDRNSDQTVPTESSIPPLMPFHARDPKALVRENALLRSQEKVMRAHRDERLAENMRLKTQPDECKAQFRAVLFPPQNQTEPE
jgi:hypothetical protein